MHFTVNEISMSFGNIIVSTYLIIIFFVELEKNWNGIACNFCKYTMLGLFNVVNKWAFNRLLATPAVFRNAYES